MNPAPASVAKKEMRREAKVTRSGAYARHGHAASESIARHGIAFARCPAPAVVSGFLAIGDEIDPTPLMQRLLGEGYRLCLPVMEGKGKPLVFRAWSPGEPLAETTWGIREPLPEAPALDPDIVLGPLLAFDTRGYRLGYGGGFYDRTLAALQPRPVTVGVGYAHGFIPWLQAEPHDVPLDAMLTEEGVLWERGD